MDSRRILTVIFVVILAAGFVGGCAGPAAKEPYRLKLEVGGDYYARMVTEQEGTYDSDQGTWTTENVSGFGNNLHVEGIEADGSAWVKFRYDWIRSKRRWGDRETEYDSAKEGIGVPATMVGYSAMLGREFMMKITPEGKMLETKGLAEVREKVLEKAGEGLEGYLRGFTLEGLKRELSENGVREFIENLVAVYPDGIVKVGDSWERSFAVTQNMAMKVEKKYTLKKRAKGVATVELVSQIKPNPEAKPFVIENTEISYNLSGKQNGTLQIREATGEILQATINERIYGDMKIKSERTGPEGDTWPIESKVSTTFELTRRKK